MTVDVEIGREPQAPAQQQHQEQIRCGVTQGTIALTQDRSTKPSFQSRTKIMIPSSPPPTPKKLTGSSNQSTTPSTQNHK